ncbi:hypothetical protein EO244_05860 [Ancylomarina salipaludis]|uniref:DUF2127 domain-containing protein n=1 Tax=Ancylomarina salipaludis TaxID=2501299 RepID=A0A4Q1JMR2_9BACT|nr:hypothetical protein [Ancylomarina salipaludis]RXQ95832.1 hypothetical protein EO244_05860 [Ancylomarina salipaludis]
MSKLKYYKGLFLVAAIYDLILGLVFTFFPKSAFDLIGILEKAPGFMGYLSLIGAYLLIIGIAYLLIYRGNLNKNLDLILIGLLYKFAYCSIVFYYFIIGDLPHIIFLVLFGFIDLIMLILMIECYVTVKRKIEI